MSCKDEWTSTSSSRQAKKLDGLELNRETSSPCLSKPLNRTSPPEPFDSSSIFHLATTINGHPADAIIDSGASENIISVDFAFKNQLIFLPLEDIPNLEVADGRTLEVSHYALANLSFSVMDADHIMDIKTRLLIAPIRHSEVILGKPWLARHNPVINWTTNQIQELRTSSSALAATVQDQRSAEVFQEEWTASPPMDVVPVGSSDKPIQEVVSFPSEVIATPSDNLKFQKITRRKIASLVKKGTHLCVAYIKKVVSKTPLSQEDSFKKNSDEILTEFEEIFPEELPPGLPVERSVLHRIDEKPDAVPINGPVYRLSANEQEELLNIS